MNLKKRISVCACLVMLSLYVTPVYATMTLEEALSQSMTENATTTEQTQQQQPVQTQQSQQGSLVDGFKKSDNETVKNLTKSADITQYDDGTVQTYVAPFQRVIGKLVLILSYLTVSCQIAFFAVDMFYLAVPPSRKWLANGHIGNPQAGNQMTAGAVGGGLGDMGMMNSGGLYGGRFGHMGGGYGSGYGMGTGMSSMMNPYQGNPGMTDMGSRTNRTQWVSNAAISAAASETAVTTDGSVNNKFKLYFSQMVLDGIILGILIVLNITGLMQVIGFAIGGIVVNGVGSFLK